MANFPTWINKRNSATSTTNSSLSPRQVANKAYTLAIKKLDRDDKRRRPQYTVRERLLLSNTMAKAEDVLNKRTTRFNRRVLAFEDHDDDYVKSAPPAKKMAIATTPVPAPATVIVDLIEEVVEEKKVTPTVKELPQIQAKKNESPLPTPEQIAVSIAVVAAAAAYTSLTVAEQQHQQSLHDFCRPILIPSHSLTSFTTII